MAQDTRAEMPFLDHLEELRWRIIYSLAALVVGLGIAFVIVLRVDVIGLLEHPILPYLGGKKLVYTHPGDPFSITLNTALILGGVIALPVILYQVWAFLSPALYRHEKKVVIPVFMAATLLFLCGVAMSYFFVLPMTLRFLMGFETTALEPMVTASEYFGFVVSMSLAFGAVFELPIAILALTALGIVTPQFLSRYRRHALVFCYLGAAIITPGDIFATTLALTVPLYGLYEMSIWLSYVVYRRRARREAELAAEAAADAAAAESSGPRGLMA